jgi:hydroxyacylglutathione hydrolase
MQEWDQSGLATEAIAQMPVDELNSRINEGADLQLIDVRRPGEYKSGHVPGAVNLTLAHLDEEASRLDANRPTAVICQSGYRSSAATGILARQGFKEVFNVVGGTSAWVNAGYKVD